MLNVGLTGGIGSGKSTVARRLHELGAVVVDADAVAREALGVGSEGLPRVVEHFGEGVLSDDGSIDRAALARIVFGDEQARLALESITHPLIRARTAELVAAADEDAVVVHDVPLLVEKRLAPEYHLVLVVHAPVEERVRRLTEARRVSEADARARMEHQAGDDERRAVADIWLPNPGTVDELEAAVDAVWRDRIAPYRDNLAAGRIHRPENASVARAYDERWPQQAARLIERVGRALGERAPGIEHVGSTAVSGMPGKDAIDIQVGVRSLAEADDPAFVSTLAALGFPRVDDYRMDHPVDELPDPSLWVKRFHGSCDPGQVTHLHVREISSAGWQYALLFRDWLRATPEEADTYVEMKRRVHAEATSVAEYRAARAPWFNDAWSRMTAWAQRSGWNG